MRIGARYLIVDYHIHTQRSSDGKGSMEDYIQKAMNKQLEEIGFSDHIDRERLVEHPVSFAKMMSRYVQNFLLLKKQSRVKIKLGSEVDYFPDQLNRIREILKEYPFDYVIGSVHFIDNWGVDSSRQRDEHSRRDPLESYEKYFRLVREMCATRLFDIVGHPDLIKIFGLKPSKDVSQIYEETAWAIADSQMCVEINAKGLVRPCKEIYPNLQFLKILHGNSVPITFGSDAHSPEDLGLNLNEASKWARSAGFKEACTFEGRKKTSYGI
jgi:histidinol-phosphatase (PHP family)